MGALTVAAAQAVSARGDVKANLDQHCRLAELAADAGASVTVFPELSLTGYEPGIAAALAFSAEDERLKPLVDLADSRKVTLVVGAPVRLASGLHIGAFVIERGSPMRVYTKRHLHAGEESVFSPGPLDPMIKLGDERAALAICAGTSHPEHAEAAARRGASLYLAGVFFTPEDYPAAAARLADYAALHSMGVVMANAGAASSEFTSPGGG